MVFNPTIDKRLAREKLDRIFGDLRSGKLFLTCGKHNYVAYIHKGAVKPPTPRGCPTCWDAYFKTDYALTDPNIQYERLAELDEVIHRAVEFEKKGTFGQDFELYSPQDSRFHINIEKDAADDETGQDKIVTPGEEKLN